MFGAGAHTHGFKITGVDGTEHPTAFPKWTVTMEFTDGTSAVVLLGPEAWCFRHGSWTPHTHEQARIAAVEVLVDRYRESIERETRNLTVRRGA